MAVSVQPQPKYNLGFRQGKSATTLRNQYSQNKTFMSELPYTERTKRKVWSSYVGARPIHRTTLVFDRSKPKLDYVTLYNHYFKGSKDLQGVRRPPSCPSMFTSQWDIGENKETHFKTINHEMFPPKQVIPVWESRKTEVANRFKATHGLKMMEVTDSNHGASYSTSYRVDHDSLGRVRGPGVPHYRKKPPQFNVITGCNYEKPTLLHHRRLSGNRVLWQQRKDSARERFQLG